MARVDGSIDDMLAAMSPGRGDGRYAWEETQAKFRSIMQVRQPFRCLRILPLQGCGGDASDMAQVFDTEVKESMAAFAYLDESIKDEEESGDLTDEDEEMDDTDKEEEKDKNDKKREEEKDEDDEKEEEKDCGPEKRQVGLYLR